VTFLAAAMLASLAACGGSQTTGPTTAPTPSSVATPTATAGEQPEVVLERDLAFATWNDLTLTLDLYAPADPVGAPIVVEPGEAFGHDIAEAGAFAVIERTGIPDQPDSADGEPPFWDDHGALIRAHAEATACKIRYARARASELGSDDPVVALGGFSAGAGMAAHVALFGDTLEQRWDEFAAMVGGPPRQVDCVVGEGSTRVDALVVGNGTYDAFVPVIEGGLFGRTYVLERAPELQPFLAGAVGIDPSLTVRLMAATGDKSVPMSITTDFAKVLADAGYDVQVITYEGQHASDPPDELSLEVYSEVLGL
jgi:predicted esterase/predicted small lipoprotein YifL